MFEEEVHVKKKGDLRFGYTKKKAHETMNDIQDLLDEYDCSEVVTQKKGDKMKIGFIYQGKPYKLNIPRVYINGRYNEKVGPRVVYHFLEIVLSWTDSGIISMDKALMASRMVRIKGKDVSLGEASDKLPDGSMKGMLSDDVDKLPDSKEDYENVNYEVVDD